MFEAIGEFVRLSCLVACLSAWFIVLTYLVVRFGTFAFYQARDQYSRLAKKESRS